MINKKIILITAIVIFNANITSSYARETIKIVGSSTVYPFAKAVSRRFNQITNLNLPEIEATGSGSGFKLFCAGVGEGHPDINNASRAMQQSEKDLCAKNGVKEVSELLIGYDGIALANSVLVDQYNFRIADLSRGLSKWIINDEGQFVENQFTKWNEVNPALPDAEIKVFGPPASSGTRDAFSELVLIEHAKQHDKLRALYNYESSDVAKIKTKISELNISPSHWDAVVKNKGDKASGKDLIKFLATQIRDDGAYIETGENDNTIVNELVSSPYALGILGYGFVQQNKTKVRAAQINDSAATSANIGNGTYPLARGLYFYVKKAHINLVPGLHDYVKLFLSRSEVGTKGYLQNIGLITLDKSTYQSVKNTANQLNSNI